VAHVPGAEARLNMVETLTIFAFVSAVRHDSSGSVPTDVHGTLWDTANSSENMGATVVGLHGHLQSMKGSLGGFHGKSKERDIRADRPWH